MHNNMELSQLKPNPDNPRDISADKLKKLTKSIKDFEKMMAIRPIVVDENNVVLGGNMRLEALKRLGYTSIPDNWVKRVEGLTSAEKREFIIKDNVGFGNWDWDTLQIEWDISELESWGLDIPEENFALEEEKEIEEPEEKEPLSIDVVEGDLIEFICQDGRVHRLLCGDATCTKTLDQLMADKKADMVFTDPPYNTGMVAKNDSTRLSHMFNDSYTEEEWSAFLESFLNSYDIAIKNDSFLYICLDWRRSHELVPRIKERWRFSNLIVWDKIVHGLGPDYKYTHEFIHVCKKGKPPEAKNRQGEKEYQDVWRIQRKIGGDKSHATKKPIELCERAIKHASLKKQIVLDLFAGSGSTMIAAHQLGRIAYNVELEPKYCQVVINRMQQLKDIKEIKINGKEYGRR